MTKLKNIPTSSPKELSQKKCNNGLIACRKSFLNFKIFFMPMDVLHCSLFFKVLIHQEKTELFAM